MKKLRGFCKILLAGITAVAILCGIFALYYTLPVHISNPQKNTDYVWPAHSFWAKMTEGLSWGRFDANGYNNLEVIENPDILILGSSHMEATNVLPTENLGYLLNEKLQGKYSVYNMGISGHDLIKTCKYLPATMALYEEEPKFIIIETSSTNIRQAAVDALLEGTVEFSPSYEDSLIATLQKLPFFRLTYLQLTGGLLDLFLAGKPTAAKPTSTSSAALNTESYEALFDYIDDAAQDTHTQIIIVYHPTGELREDGNVHFNVDEGTALFAEKCREHGISFVDMTEPFLEMYRNDHKLPHGFITGTIGSGHLNADGHAAIAQQLVSLIAAHGQED